MYLSDSRLVVSATDLVGFLCCPHLTSLSLEVANGMLAPPPRSDPELEVLQRRGIEHEQTYLADLRSRGLEVVEIGQDCDVRDSVAQTRAAMRSGVDVIYQATFLDERGWGPAWRAHADFLRKVGVESDLGKFSYEPEDTKLARSPRPDMVIQLCHYAEQLAAVQGHEPDMLHLILGGGTRAGFRYRDASSYYRAAKSRFIQALATVTGTYPQRVAHCAVCPWQERCAARWDADDHLCRVAGLRADQERKLQESAGISTLTGLAESSESSRVQGIGEGTFSRLRSQARLQLFATSRPEEPPPYELRSPAEPGQGLSALPQPSEGDLFFDIEGDPFEGDAGLEYLFGVSWLEDGEERYRAFWAHDAAQERSTFEQLVDFLVARLQRFPDMHVFHYASYERSALERLMGRHATREEEIDSLFRGEILVDLYRVVRQGVLVGIPSYSLKKLEPLYMGRRSDDISDAASSIVAYEEWLKDRDAGHLAAIERYNRTDCQSARLLRDWLERRREELASSLGTLLPRPAARPTEPSEGVAKESEEVDELVAKLTGGRGEPPSSDTGPEDRARWLLAQLLGWHRREEKPEWWRYFDRVMNCSEEDLRDDPEAVAGLDYVGVVAEQKRSLVREYRFDPSQECRLQLGRAVDPAAARMALLAGESVPSPGTLVDLDPARGTLRLKRAASSSVVHPTSLIPPSPRRSDEQKRALLELARFVGDNGVDATGPFRAARDLLLRRPPRLKKPCGAGSLRAPGESAVESAVRLAHDLHGGCLAVQGPPGSGKTYTAARIVVDLVAAGHRVGITANSHAVISKLLTDVIATGHESGVRIRAIQKTDAPNRCECPEVDVTDSNGHVVSAVREQKVDVVAGTAWLFSRQDLASALDYLIVDEAGQLSLANALAVSQAAENLILVGDPRQLAQPSKGTHPAGAGSSALDHLLGDAETIPEDRGLFLDTSRRMHPLVCRPVSELFYEGRLESELSCARQEVHGDDGLGGAGLRFLPVHHSGNRIESKEETDQVCRLYSSLLDRRWTNSAGQVATIAPDDILVVAPFNAQVALLTDRLPYARVGTVDKFQGQEAAVVLISLAASSADEVPRGIDFLYSPNRLNVAVSRAKALAVLVASPKLLAVRCRTVEHLRLANGLCRLAEVAQTLGPSMLAV